MLKKQLKVLARAALVCFAPCLYVAPLQAQSSVDDLVIITEEYPPYNFKVDGKLSGICTEIVGELLKRVGSKQTVKDIQLLSWARGYKLTLKAPGHALYSTTRTKSRENLFKWVGPFVPTTIGVIAKKKSLHRINTIEDLHALRIGVVKDDVGQLLLQELEMPSDRIEPVLENRQNYQKLKSDRIDAIAYESHVADWQLKKLGEDPKEYQEIYILKESNLYLALHIDTPDSVVATLQNGLDDMKADGTHYEILARYLTP